MTSHGSLAAARTLRVQVGAEQDLVCGGGRELAKQRDARTGQAWVEARRTGFGALLEPVRPLLAHELQGPEGVIAGRFYPEPVEQPGDDGVLLRLAAAGQRRAGHAPLDEQGDGAVEVVRGVQMNGAVPGPGTQPVGLVRRLRVPPADLEHQPGTRRVPHGRDPSRLATGLKRLTGLDRPQFLAERMTAGRVVASHACRPSPSAVSTRFAATPAFPRCASSAMWMVPPVR
jgi:hypothetical protein